MTENDTPLQTPIRVMIVDDHEIVRRGIAEIVDRADDLEVVAEAGTVQDALRRAQLVSPDVILVDLQLPDGTGIDIMESLGQTNPEIRPIVLTSFDDDEVHVTTCSRPFAVQKLPMSLRQSHRDVSFLTNER